MRMPAQQFARTAVGAKFIAAELARAATKREPLPPVVVTAASVIGAPTLPVREPTYTFCGSGSDRTWEIDTEPVPAPRMTRRDKWKKRPCVMRYFAYRDTLRAAVGKIPVPDEMHLTFGFPVPSSWSKKKRAAMIGKPHRQRPDRDNCDKAVMDSLFEEDGGVWRGSQEKVWASGKGFVKIRVVYLNQTTL